MQGTGTRTFSDITGVAQGQLNWLRSGRITLAIPTKLLQDEDSSVMSWAPVNLVDRPVKLRAEPDRHYEPDGLL